MPSNLCNLWTNRWWVRPANLIEDDQDVIASLANNLSSATAICASTMPKTFNVTTARKRKMLGHVRDDFRMRGVFMDVLS